jgi:putative transposase
MEKEFNYEEFEKQAIEELRAGRGALGKDGVLTPLLKRFLEKALQAELEVHLEEEKEKANRRNGKGSKRVRSSVGSFDLDTPRDRQGSFEPEIVKKREVFVGEDLEEKIIRLYARGMSLRRHSGTFAGGVWLGDFGG